MTEEIIIDDVDVSGCDRLRTYRDWTYSSDKWCGISNDGGCECEQNVNCLYKQLKRAEIEIEKLKGVDGSVHPDSAYYKITRLEQKNKELKAQASLYENLYNHHGELVTDYRKQRGRAILYKSFLEELLYLLKTEEPFCYCSCGDEIIDRINEVLDVKY